MKVKSAVEIEIMREGGKRLSNVLNAVAQAAKPGVSGLDLDKLAEKLICEGGDTPAFLGYKPDFSHKPFPASLCVSINDEVVHGIPSKRVLKEGDIVGLDLGLVHKGLFLDMAVTVAVGEVSKEDKMLMQATRKALTVGLDAVRAGGRVNAVGKAIEKVIKPYKFGIVEELGGHGVGHEVHESPFIPHFDMREPGEMFEVGQTVAIEPMINADSAEVTFDTKDAYTVRTKDGKKSAHYEVTLVVTAEGAEVLTPTFW